MSVVISCWFSKISRHWARDWRAKRICKGEQKNKRRIHASRCKYTAVISRLASTHTGYRVGVQSEPGCSSFTLGWIHAREENRSHSLSARSHSHFYPQPILPSLTPTVASSEPTHEGTPGGKFRPVPVRIVRPTNGRCASWTSRSCGLGDMNLSIIRRSMTRQSAERRSLSSSSSSSSRSSRSSRSSAQRVQAIGPLSDPDEAKLVALAQLENIAGWALELTCNGAPDEAMKPTVGVLVGLLWSGAESASAEGAACALRSLANRGTFGDAIREAGGVRALLKLIRARDEIDSKATEAAAGTLLHLAIQQNAIKEELHASGGIRVLVGMLEAGSDCQAADYASSLLEVLTLCGTPESAAEVRASVGDLDEAASSAVEEDFPHLHRMLSRERSPATRRLCTRRGLGAAAAVVALAALAALLAHPTFPPIESALLAPGVPQLPAAFDHIMLLVKAPSVLAAMAAMLAWLLLWPRPTWSPRTEGGGRSSSGYPLPRSVEEDLLTCPITHEMMRDPVVASDGFTYERAAIREVLSSAAPGEVLSPLTREPLAPTVYSNIVVRQRIAAARAAARRAAPAEGRTACTGMTVTIVVSLLFLVSAVSLTLRS